MATDKKSFLLYCDIIHTVEKLPDDKAGQLFKHILQYTNDLNPESGDLIVQLAFEPIKQSLKRDLKKYENIVERNKANGLRGGRPKNPENPVGYLGTQENPEKPRKPDSDIVSGRVNDTDSDIEKKILSLKHRKKEFKKTLEPYLETYGREMLNAFYSYWTEDTVEGYKFRQELQETWSLERRLSGWYKRDQAKGSNNPHSRKIDL